MSAQINGAAWTATCVATANFVAGVLAIGGSDGANPIQTIGAGTAAGGPGTYPIGPPPGITNGANGLLLLGGTASWAADATKGGGTITINTLTSTAASGTFSFTLVAVPGTAATGTKTVTQGLFSVTF
jgi:hypothetical protein